MADPQVYTGSHSLENLPDILKKTAPSSLFLVTGRTSFENHHALFQDLLPSPLVRFSDFSVNPKIKDAAKGIALFNEHGCDMVLAVGGGSVMDMAKIIALCHKLTPKGIARVLDGKAGVGPKQPPLLAVPTTAGSGSEATRFAVIYKEGVKYSLAEDSLRPDYVILDPRLLRSLPPALAASSGLDAFSQAVESWWSLKSSPESELFVQKALPLIHENLFSAIAGDPAAQAGLQQGAYWAGRAIDISRTTAAHALSYTLTSQWGIPHGFAVFLNLPALLRIHARASRASCRHPRGAEWLRERVGQLARILGFSTGEELAEHLESYDTKIPQLGEYRKKFLSRKDVWDVIFDKVNLERMSTNPVFLKVKDFYDQV